MKGQAVAIGLVIAVGVLLLVMMTGLVNSLDETRRAYYERYRLADIFAPVKRAPDHLLEDIARVPGVSGIEGRVTGAALIDIPGQNLPLQAKAISLPDFHKSRLNDILFTKGRRLNADHANEILLLNSFASAHGLQPGDRLSATINGIRRDFRIVGLAQSPEFLYTTAPGELISEDGRFAVIWMSQSALAAVYDMDGAFNEALISIGRNANMAEILDAVDRILGPSGGLGSYSLDNQTSNRFIVDEIDGLRATSIGVPPIFLGVAAFLLYIVVSRMVQADREQIGLIKAFGYSNTEISAHYLKFVLIIAIAGATVGCLFGIGAGRTLAVYYLDFFKFPFLIFRLDPGSFVISFAVSVLSASAGGILVLKGILELTPATAMRPPAPADYSRTGRFAVALNMFLDQLSRMVVRRMFYQSGRTAGAVLGIAGGMALSVSIITIMSGFDRTIELSFSVVDRSDLLVSFFEAVSDKTIFELQSIDGVIHVEPVRFVPAVLKNGVNTYRGAINGLIEKPVLNRPVDGSGKTITLNPHGIILGSSLAGILDIKSGELLEVEVLEGRRPTLLVPVVAVADTLIGSLAFMEIDALNRALKEPNRVSGAYMRIDLNKSDSIYEELKNMPTVAGVNLKSNARSALQKQMDTGAGAVRYIMAIIAAIITFGIVYNSARIAYAERSRDLASLRVLGFTRNEAAFVLLGELGILTILALPIGAILGYYLSFGISSGFSTDLYQIPAVFTPESYGAAAVAVIAASVVSGWLVKRDINRLDPVLALKTRE
ncbi:MAG: permease [marine bacterium B5-7]|nr:MAG: permease [marine bacterium B5-7]